MSHTTSSAGSSPNEAKEGKMQLPAWFAGTRVVLAAINAVSQQLTKIGEQMSTFATALSTLQAAADANAAATQQVITLVTSQGTQITALQAQIATLEAGQPVTADQITQLNSITAEIAGDNTSLAALVPPAATAAPAGSGSAAPVTTNALKS